MEWKHRGFEKEVSSRTQMPWKLIVMSFLGAVQYVQGSLFSNLLPVASVYYLSLMLLLVGDLHAALVHERFTRVFSKVLEMCCLESMGSAWLIYKQKAKIRKPKESMFLLCVELFLPALKRGV